MAKHYDEQLRERLQTNNGAGTILLNKRFSRWTQTIEQSLRNRRGVGKTYGSRADRALLDICRAHAEEFEQPINGECVVMITHPFYLHLSHMMYVRETPAEQEANKYLDNLLGFLNSCRDNPNVRVAVLEAIHAYAAVTSLMLEQGLIDRVVLTEYDKGYPLREGELPVFSEKPGFIGGGYNTRCLSHSTRAIENAGWSGELWAIKDLTLNSPLDATKLTPSNIPPIPESRVIDLETAMSKIELNS